MRKLFVVTAISALALAAGGAHAMPEPDAAQLAPQFVQVKVEQVTAAAHLTWRDPEHHALIESSLMMVGEVPQLSDGGCRMRDSVQEAGPSAPKAPTSTPQAPARPDSAHPKGRWVTCS